MTVSMACHHLWCYDMIKPNLVTRVSTVVEKRPWLGLVTCFPKSRRFFKCVFGEGWQYRPCVIIGQGRESQGIWICGQTTISKTFHDKILQSMYCTWNSTWKAKSCCEINSVTRSNFCMPVSRSGFKLYTWTSASEQSNWVITKDTNILRLKKRKFCRGRKQAKRLVETNMFVDQSTGVNRPNRLTQCCTQFKSPGTKILWVLYLHDNVALIFKWYGNTWNKTFYSQRVWIGYNIELAD